jgi:hypothetical protein
MEERIADIRPLEKAYDPFPDGLEKAYDPFPDGP